MLRYMALAESLRTQIERGWLRPGERIPSIRELATNHGVSTATAVQACHQLEKEGLILARQRMGFFVCSSTPSVTIKTPSAREPAFISNPALREMRFIDASADVLPLHYARPAAALLPDAAIAAALSRCLRRQRSSALDYSPPQGHGPLRRQIAQRYVNLGAQVEAEEIIVTAGAMEAISLALRATTSPGDLILVESPAYQGILQTLAALNLRVVEFPQDPVDGIHMARLEAILAEEPVRVALVVPNFSNPSGRLLDDATKRQLLSACERHGTIILEDDVYGELAWDDSRPSPLRRWDSGSNVITCSSFSKFLAPGLRVGWIVGGRWTEELSRAKYFSTIGNTALPQLAISDYLGRHDLERGLRRLRRGLAETSLRMRDAISRYWPRETLTSQPRGGLSLWIQLPAGGDAQQLFNTSLDNGIGIAPGPLFSSTGSYGDHLRLTCGLPWDERLAQGMISLGKLVHENVTNNRTSI